MSETAQQYTARIIGNLSGEDPMSVLRSTSSRIARLIKGKNAVRLRRAPAPGKWSVVQIVAHLAETELVLAWRYRIIAEKNGVVIESFEQDVWALNSQYASSDLRSMLALFTTVRAANIAFLNGLPPKRWKNYGMHRERGKETIAHLVRMEAGHDLNHLRQIEAILKGQ